MDVIETAYQKACEFDGPFGQPDETMDDDEQESMEARTRDAENEPNQNESFKVLTSMQQETVFLDPDLENDGPSIAAEGADATLKGVSDKDQFMKLMSVSDPEKTPDSTAKADQGEKMPWTLLEAMTYARGCRFNALFRLAVRLRSAPGGCDTPWIRNGRTVRRHGSGLNWHQLHGSEFRVVCLEVFIIFHFVVTEWGGTSFCRKFQQQGTFKCYGIDIALKPL